MADNNKDTKIDELINSGADIAGGAIGGAIGLIGGAPGVIGGAVSGVLAARALKKVGSEISERVLEPREKTRVGATLALAAVEIEQRINSGEELRSDDFFDSPVNGRKKYEEFAETILIRAQKESEEKKIPYIANFLANVLFDSSINIELTHQIVKGADSLTYRQFVLLKLAAVKEQIGLKKGKFGEGNFDRMTIQLMYEIYDLAQSQYLHFGGTAVLGVSDINPSSMNPMGLGSEIYNNLRLYNIPDSDVLNVARFLK
ncbi:MAG: hypothetical protein LAT81_15195 [Oceanicaulis sp.]|nr:hypothetical protein [Oceanicaulis sp.]